MSLLRYVAGERISWVLPVEVLLDEADHIVLWQAAGSRYMRSTGILGGPRGRNVARWDGGHVEEPWTGAGVIRAHRKGDPWSVWRWEAGHAWRPGYYINLEEPWRRTPFGFDSGDWILDLIIAEDGTVVRKDEDELAWALRAGLIDAARAERIESVATDALATRDGGGWPFSADWDEWLDLRTSKPVAIPPDWRDHLVPNSGL